MITLVILIGIIAALAGWIEISWICAGFLVLALAAVMMLHADLLEQLENTATHDEIWL